MYLNNFHCMIGGYDDSDMTENQSSGYRDDGNLCFGPDINIPSPLPGFPAISIASAPEVKKSYPVKQECAPGYYLENALCYLN